MYSPITAKRLLDKEGKRMSDLAEYIFHDRRHSVKHLFVEGANPTAQTLLGMAEFFHVPMDILFDRQIAGSVAGGADNDLLKKFVVVYRTQRKKIIVHDKTEQRDQNSHGKDGFKNEAVFLTACTEDKDFVIRDKATKAHEKSYKSCKGCGLCDDRWQTISNELHYGTQWDSLFQNGFRKE